MNKIKVLLGNRNLTIPKLSEILRTRFNCYKYRQQISQWVNGIRLPDIESVYYLSQIINVSCDDLIPMFMEIKNVK